MKKLALALATTAALGFAAPAFAADNDMSGTKAQTQAPAGQSTSPSAQTQSPTSSPSTQAQTPSPSTSTQTPSAQNPSTQSPAAQNKTPSMQNNAAAQTEVKGKAKSKVSAKTNKAKMAHHRRGTNQLARHDRGFKRGH